MSIRAGIKKILFIFLILLICYAIEYYIRIIEFPSYFALIILTEIEAFIVSLFFSIDHIKSWRKKGKLKINYLYIFSALLLLLLRMPFTPLIAFNILRILRYLTMILFWYLVASAFYKEPITHDE
jgi:hypothetical protein